MSVWKKTDGRRQGDGMWGYRTVRLGPIGLPSLEGRYRMEGSRTTISMALLNGGELSLEGPEGCLLRSKWHFYPFRKHPLSFIQCITQQIQSVIHSLLNISSVAFFGTWWNTWQLIYFINLYHIIQMLCDIYIYIYIYIYITFNDRYLTKNNQFLLLAFV
jgi:hypothetical protein